MKTNTFLASSILLLILFLTACGSQPNNNSEDAVIPAGKEELQTEAPKVGGNVVGPCTLVGDIRSFEISSDQKIQSYSFTNKKMSLSFSAREKLTIKNTKLNGVEYDINIEVQKNKVVGYEKLVEKIDLKIMLQDNSSCDISLWEAK